MSMVASLLLKGRVDSSLTKSLGKAEKDMDRTARSTKGRARSMARASEDTARATSRAAGEAGRAAAETNRLGQSMGRAAEKSRKLGRGLKQGVKRMREAGSAAKLLNKGLDAMGNRWAALGAGAALTLAGRQVGNVQERMTRLGIQAGLAQAEVNKLKNQIYETARAPEIRVNPAQIMDAVDAIVEKTGDLTFAEQNIRNIGIGIQATGAMGKDIGEILAEFQKMDIKDPKEVLEALDILNKQGKMGAFTLQNIAALGPRVITAYTSAGRGGTQALREMGAVLQLIRMGTGSSEMAATAFEAVMRSLLDPTKIKQLEGLGVNLFDEEQLAQGKRVLRPINELMKEIVEAGGADKVVLGSVFDAEAIRAFNTAISEHLKTGGVETLDKFMQVQGDGKTTTEDSARAAQTFNQALGMLYTSAEKFADTRLTGVLESITGLLDRLGTEGADNLMTVGMYAAGTVASLLAARKVFQGGRALLQGGRWIRDRLRGRKAGIASAKDSGSGALDLKGSGPMPVEVINWPGAMGGGPGQGSGLESFGSGKDRKGRSGQPAKVERAPKVARATKAGRASRLLRGGRGLFKGAGRLLGKAFRPLGMLLGAGGLMSTASSLVGASPGNMAVEVVNWPGGGPGSAQGHEAGMAASSRMGQADRSMIGGKVGQAGGAARKAGRASRFLSGGRGLFKGAGRLLGKAFRPLGMLLGAADLIGATRSGDKTRMGRAAGSMAGGLGGGALGATLGTFILPGIGTAVGGLLGSLVGDMFGGKVGETAGQVIGGQGESSAPVPEQVRPAPVSAPIPQGGRSVPAQAPAQPKAQTVTTTQNIVNHFHITQQPGEDAEALARRVAALINRPRTGDLYDG